MNFRPPGSAREADALMIDAWAARHLDHLDDVSVTRASRLQATSLWVRHVVALQHLGPGSAPRLPTFPRGR